MWAAQHERLEHPLCLAAHTYPLSLRVHDVTTTHLAVNSVKPLMAAWCFSSQFKHHADTKGLMFSWRISIMHECSPGELLMHHDDQGQSSSKHYTAHQGLKQVCYQCLQQSVLAYRVDMLIFYYKNDYIHLAKMLIGNLRTVGWN